MDCSILRGIDGGIQYAYDAANRLTQIADYDSATLTYAYDNEGRATSQVDYHGNTTSYTYTARNQLSTLTAPGSRVWEFTYNDLGQPESYTHPNGIETDYSYDSHSRMTKIEHNDDTTALARYTYALDAGGLISRVTQVDNSYWDYLYDGRYRLTKADRYNSTGHVKAEYVYTYDAGDNMVSKVEPFTDDFNDGAYTGWTVVSGTWSASSNYLATTTSSGAISKATTDGDAELRFRFMDTNTALNNAATIYARFNESNWSYLYLRITPSQLQLMQYSGGAYTTFDTNTSATTTSNTWYNYRIVCDGATVKVYRNVDGALEQQVLSTTSATVTTTQDVRMGVWSNHRVDDVRILADDLTNTTTFTMDNANELSTMTDPNGTTAFAYDQMGRMTSKSCGGYSATYGYRSGNTGTSMIGKSQ